MARRLLYEEELPRGSVLIPTGDLALRILSRHREELSRRFRLSVPPWEVCRRLLNKAATRTAAIGLGIPVPGNYGATDGADSANLRFPVVLKPNDSHAFQATFGRKVRVARTADEYRKFKAEMHAAGQAGEVQDLVPGPDSLSYNDTAYYDREGSRIAEFPIHKLRKSPPSFGIGRVVERSSNQAVNRRMREYTDAFAQAIGWHGPVSAEYKLDPRDDRLYLIEVNGRCSFVQQLAWRSGVNYAWLQYRDACNLGPESMSPGPEYASLIHLHADLLNAMLFRRVERLPLRELIRPYLARRYFAVWDARDPWPFVAEWSRTFGMAFAWLFNGEIRRQIANRAVRFD